MTLLLAWVARLAGTVFISVRQASISTELVFICPSVTEGVFTGNMKLRHS